MTDASAAAAARDRTGPSLDDINELALNFVPSIIIDNGSGLMKAGFTGEDCPRLYMPTVATYHKKTIVQTSESDHETRIERVERTLLVGRKAVEPRHLHARSVSSLLHPINHGIIENFDIMESIWESVFDTLRPKDSSINMPVLLTEASENPPENRYKMAEIMFEKFKVPALYVARRPVLDLFSTGRTSGLVLDIGHGVTRAVPIFEGFVLSHAVVRNEFGGKELTDYMARLIRDRLERRRRQGRHSETSSPAVSNPASARTTPRLADGSVGGQPLPSTRRKLARGRSMYRKTIGLEHIFSEARHIEFDTIGGRRVAERIKEKLCATAPHSLREALERDHEEREYILPDRSVVTIGPKEVYSVPEALFRPRMIFGGRSGLLGIHEQVHKVYTKCDEYTRRLLASNIVLAGGSSMFDGIKRRLRSELNRMSGTVNTCVDGRRERHHAAWVGGSILASFSSFKDVWITGAAYDEIGRSVVFSKLG